MIRTTKQTKIIHFCGFEPQYAEPLFPSGLPSSAGQEEAVCGSHKLKLILLSLSIPEKDAPLHGCRIW